MRFCYAHLTKYVKMRYDPGAPVGDTSLKEPAPGPSACVRACVNWRQRLGIGPQYSPRPKGTFSDPGVPAAVPLPVTRREARPGLLASVSVRLSRVVRATLFYGTACLRGLTDWFVGAGLGGGTLMSIRGAPFRSAVADASNLRLS